MQSKTKSGAALALLFLTPVMMAADNRSIQQAAQTKAFVDPEPAKYVVRMTQIQPPRLAVTAVVPINGKTLSMDTTRSADVPEVGDHGWPALIRNLRIKDAEGHSLEVTNAGKTGWELKESFKGSLILNYEVDYSGPAAHQWPAPRETAFADPNHFVFVGRSLFITTPEVGASTVTFRLPRTWHAVTPWRPTSGSAGVFAVRTIKDLVVNLIVLTRSKSDTVTAGTFRVFITPMGHWQPVRPLINRALKSVIPRFIQLMGFEEREDYSVVLLPVLESGGESYRSSFAFSVDSAPSSANRSSWEQTIAHEIFHYWNGWRLRGSDYQSSQWFQEGFTEYVADLATVGSGLVTPEDFRQQLSTHIMNYQKLATSLEAPGNQKGPPLYSGGALVAFCWDVQIRHSTRGQRNIGDFLRALWRETNASQRPYEWKDIRTALNLTASSDWDAFFRAYISGTKPLPLDKILSQAGLRLIRAEDGSSHIESDPLASTAAKSLWKALVNAR